MPQLPKEKEKKRNKKSTENSAVAQSDYIRIYT